MPDYIFFDKTHTDKNGRLCIEKIRFTLGIFKREIRNQSNAWRSYGYILNQNQIQTLNATAKMQDYQFMTKMLLSSYQKAKKI